MVTSNLSKSSKINFKDNDSKESSRLFKKLKMENDDVQNDYEREIMQQRSNISINDEVQNNPNLHSEEEDKQETPDGRQQSLVDVSWNIENKSTAINIILINEDFHNDYTISRSDTNSSPNV
ncbi:hypothetical protein RhiirA4_474746 [Rhizophagus irregularis]|uniref:Uncharacterized protein n=1 Tax=Rhizophagus irregularis TaxID=588596 RepID=A0A2I1H8Z5_9GLOM|nr:hypothetical protein RhiirA4_474746 [Rhizophagus irregularis]